MTPNMKTKILNMLSNHGVEGPNCFDFEIAYQTRIAIDRIRFAIKQTEASGSRSDQAQETAFQLLDALNRLESLDRLFQEMSGIPSSRLEEVRKHG